MILSVLFEKIKEKDLQKLPVEVAQKTRNRIKQNVVSKKKIRSDAVKALKIKFEVQQEFSKKAIKKIERCLHSYFVCSDNLIFFQLFNKKQILVLVTPITKDQRLCAKEFYGSAPLKHRIKSALLSSLNDQGISQVKITHPITKSIPKSAQLESALEIDDRPAPTLSQKDIENFKALSIEYRRLKKEYFKLKKQLKSYS